MHLGNHSRPCLSADLNGNSWVDISIWISVDPWVRKNKILFLSLAAQQIFFFLFLSFSQKSHIQTTAMKTPHSTHVDTALNSILAHLWSLSCSVVFLLFLLIIHHNYSTHGSVFHELRLQLGIVLLPFGRLEFSVLLNRYAVNYGSLSSSWGGWMHWQVAKGVFHEWQNEIKKMKMHNVTFCCQWNSTFYYVCMKWEY